MSRPEQATYHDQLILIEDCLQSPQQARELIEKLQRLEPVWDAVDKDREPDAPIISYISLTVIEGLDEDLFRKGQKMVLEKLLSQPEPGTPPKGMLLEKLSQQQAPSPNTYLGICSQIAYRRWLNQPNGEMARELYQVFVEEQAATLHPRTPRFKDLQSVLAGIEYGFLRYELSSLSQYKLSSPGNERTLPFQQLQGFIAHDLPFSLDLSRARVEKTGFDLGEAFGNNPIYYGETRWRTDSPHIRNQTGQGKSRKRDFDKQGLRKCWRASPDWFYRAKLVPQETGGARIVEELGLAPGYSNINLSAATLRIVHTAEGSTREIGLYDHRKDFTVEHRLTESGQATKTQVPEWSFPKVQVDLVKRIREAGLTFAFPDQIEEVWFDHLWQFLEKRAVTNLGQDKSHKETQRLMAAIASFVKPDSF